jgi:protocatechuate 3,4-dioxygenase beta subunit
MRKRGLVAAIVTLAAIAALVMWWRRGAGAHDQVTESRASHAVDVRTPRGERATDEPTAPVLVDDDPRGTLRLEGQVVDAQEHPVGGAIVVLSSNPPRTATTEGDGSFAFDALVGRAYTLIARATQGVAGPVTAKLTAKSEPVILHLRPAAKVTVAVVGMDGKPIDKANVELRSTDAQRMQTEHGEAVFFPVVPGGYQIAAWADGMARTLQFTRVGAGENHAKLMLQVGAPVSGKVVDTKGAPVSGARISYQGTSNWQQRGDPRFDSVTSGTDGTFKFAAVAAGSVRFVAAHPEYAPGESALITLDGTNEHKDVKITVDPGAIIRGRVVDTQEQPVVAAQVRIGVATRRQAVGGPGGGPPGGGPGRGGPGGGGGGGGPGGFQPPREAFTDDQGKFEIHGMPKLELAAVALHETGSSQTKSVDATRGDVADVELVLDRTGTIAGVVIDPDGNVLEGVQVTAGPNFSAGAQMDFAAFRLRGMPQELTDASGRFTLTGLEPGKYMVSAMRSRAAGRGRRPGGDGTPADTGTTNLKIVLPPEGGVRGHVQFTDGTPPIAITVQVGATQQSFVGGDFELDEIAPQSYSLEVRGPSFQLRTVDVLIEPGKVADVGAILVEKGRSIAGIVVANGTPVANATVYAGLQVMGNGSTTGGQIGNFGAGTKQDTTASDGTFALSGFGDGDLTVIADLPSAGRSPGILVSADNPNAQQLVLQLQPYGTLSGTITQNGQPAAGTMVTCQSTSTPGELYNVASGPDGTYQYDALAPDTYKVSATVGNPRRGMQFYSQQAVVPPGGNAVVNLGVAPGNVTVQLTATASNGQLGMASSYLASGQLTAATASQLSLQLAQLGQSLMQWVIIRQGAPAVFNEVVPGTYSACVIAFPTEVAGRGAMGYVEKHGNALPAVCEPVTIQPTPDTQTIAVPVLIPPYIPDSNGGSGAGSSATGGAGATGAR